MQYYVNDFKDIVNNRYIIYSDGRVYDSMKSKFKPQKTTTTGYKAVSLIKSTGGSYWCLVHQLVMTFYSEKPEGDYVVDHKDCDKSNNKVENLEWVTRKENSLRAHKNKLFDNSGDKNFSATISNELAHKICRELEELQPSDLILIKVGMEVTPLTRQLVVRIKNKLAWTDISKDYNIHPLPLPTIKQYPLIKNLENILKLAEEGKRPYEIMDKLFPDLSKEERHSRFNGVGKIIKGEIFKQYVDYIKERSTTSKS